MVGGGCGCVFEEWDVIILVVVFCSSLVGDKSFSNVTDNEKDRSEK